MPIVWHFFVWQIPHQARHFPLNWCNARPINSCLFLNFSLRPQPVQCFLFFWYCSFDNHKFYFHLKKPPHRRRVLIGVSTFLYRLPHIEMFVEPKCFLLAKRSPIYYSHPFQKVTFRFSMRHLENFRSSNFVPVPPQYINIQWVGIFLLWAPTFRLGKAVRLKTDMFCCLL